MIVCLRKFENLRNFILNTEKVDLEFLESCKKDKLILELLQFKVANKWLESSEAYLNCERHLLNQEISIKYETM